MATSRRTARSHATAPCCLTSARSCRRVAGSLADTALILDVLAGYDPNDSDTRPVAAPAFLETVVEDPPLPPRFAFVITPVWNKANVETGAAFEARSGGWSSRLMYQSPGGYAARLGGFA